MAKLEEFLVGLNTARPAGPIVLDEPVPLDALPTPALLIDVPVFEANISRMQSHLDTEGLGLRCHTKMHKCPIIAKKQLAAGALGVCAAKIGEAEVMQASGVNKILITSPVTTDEKMLRVVALGLSNPLIEIVVDSKDSADRLNAHCKEAGVELGVFVDIDPGMGRTGIEAGEPTLSLAQHIQQACDCLRFAGLQMYAGNCMHVEGFQKREEKYRHVMQKGLDTRELFVRAGVEIPAFSGGGTGTYNMETALGLMTDLQAGSYCFMDIEYRDIGGKDAELFDDFEPSLFVLVTAISKPQQRLITVDGGFKSFASDKMAPQFRDVEGVVYHWGGDEHGIVQLNNPSLEINPGDKLPMLTPHCDPTVNLHDFYYPVEDGVVKELWPVAARGCSQ